MTSASRSLLLSAKQLAQVHRAEAQEPAIGGLAYRKQLAQVHRAEVRLSSCRLPPVQKQLAQVHRAEALYDVQKDPNLLEATCTSAQSRSLRTREYKSAARMKQLAQVHRAEARPINNEGLQKIEATCTSAQSRRKSSPISVGAETRSNLHKCAEQKPHNFAPFTHFLQLRLLHISIIKPQIPCSVHMNRAGDFNVYYQLSAALLTQDIAFRLRG